MRFSSRGDRWLQIGPFCHGCRWRSFTRRFLKYALSA
jgi:hypothetical protein